MNGLLGPALELAMVAVPLMVLPGQESFTPAKVGALLLAPALLLLAAPGRLAAGVGAELRTWPGRLALLLVLGLAARQGLDAAGALAAGLVLLAAARSLPAEALETHAARAAVAVLLVVGAAAAVQMAPPPGWGWLTFGIAEQPVGFSGNRNQLAYLTTLLMPLALVAAGRRQGAWRYPGILAALVALALLPATHCRGAVLVLVAVGFARWFLPASVARAEATAPRAVVVLVLVTLAPLALVRFEEPLRALFPPGKAATLSTRVEAWRTALPLVRTAGPLGHGPGSFGRVFPGAKEARYRAMDPDERIRHAANARVTRRAHLELLEVTIEWGWIGLALVLAWAVFALGGGLRDLAGIHRPGDRARRRLGLAGTAGVIVAAGFHFPFQEAPTAMVALVFLALARGPHPGEEARHASPLAGVLAFALVVGAGWVGARELRHQRALSAGLAAISKGEVEPALRALEAARTLRPSARVENTLGRIRMEAGNPRVALESFRRAEALEPSFTHALNRALALRALGKRPEARDALEVAFYRQPSQQTAFMLGMARESAGDLPGAIAVYEEGARMPDFDPRLGYSLGRLYWKTAREEEALETLRTTEAAAADPGRVTPDRVALAARLRIECLRLIEAIRRAAGEEASAEDVRRELLALVPGFTGAGMDPPGAPEGRW